MKPAVRLGPTVPRRTSFRWISRVKSPAQVMIDTLGKIIMDMRNDQKRDDEVFKKTMHRCKTELKSQEKVMQEDLSNMKTATQKVKEDLAAAGKSGNQVELARKKCDAIRESFRK